MTDFQQINDFVEYLQALKRAENVLVLMAAKDTLGYHIGKAGYSALKDLGLTKIGSHPKEEEHQCGYAAILKNSEVLFEKMATRDRDVSFIDEIEGISVKVVSSPYRSHNCCELWIGDIQYGLNIRGINIIVVNYLTNRVLDAVTFDTHSIGRTCFHRGNLHELIQKNEVHLSLYYLCTGANVFNEIAYSQGIEEKNQVVYLLDRGIFTSRGYEAFFSKLKAENLCFDYIIDSNLLMNKSSACTEDEAKERLCTYFDGLLLKSGYQLDDFDDIYIFTDDWDVDFPAYLNLVNRRYHYVEAVKNNFIRKYKNLSNADDAYVELFNCIQPFNGLAKNADPILVDSSNVSQAILKKHEKSFRTWNRESALAKISDSKFHVIMKSFDADIHKSLLDNSDILILNSYAWLGDEWEFHYGNTIKARYLTGLDDYHKSLYQSSMNNMVLDFFSTDQAHVIIKTHPNDPIYDNLKKELYGDGVTVLNNVPFELLKRYLDEEQIVFKRAIGYFSSSLQMLSSENYESSVILGNGLFITFFFYISLFVTIQLAINNGFNIRAKEYMAIQLKNLLEIQNGIQRIDVFEKEDISDLSDNRNEIQLINILEDNFFYLPQILKAYAKGSLLFILNVELCDNIYLPELYLSNLLIVRIEENEIRDLPVKTERDEYIWIYATDQKDLRELKIDTVERTLQRRGLHFKSRVLSSAEKYEHYRQLTMESRLDQEMKEMQAHSRILQGLTVRLIGKDGYLRQEAAEMLRSETDFDMYLRILALMQKNLLILIAVRDTPGDQLSVQTLRLLYELGFSNFNKRLWLMYAGMNRKGEVLLDQSGGCPEETVTYKHNADRSLPDIFIQSSAWRKENVASIKIDGKDYATNIRGINIVVYDLAANEVIDSVGYDRHTEDVKFVHLEK